VTSDTQAGPVPPTTRRQSRGRATAVWVVLVLAGLLLLLSSFAVWINRVALNTSVFTDTSSSLLDNDQIRSAVANRAVDELFANVDVQAEVEEQLPADYKGLSGAAAAGLRQASYQIVDRALEQPRLQDLFRLAVEESHTTLVEVLEGGGDRVSTEEGEVTLDLRRIISEAADRIGIGDQVVDRIPADAGQIEILRSDELDTAQNAFQLLKTLAWVLPLLTLVAFGVAVWLARDRRRAARGIGWVLVTVGLVGLVAARLTRNYVVDSLVAREDDRRAANDAWDILTDLMRGSFRLMIVVGLLFLLAAWLAGPGRRALTARGWLAPGLQNRTWAYAALAIIGLVLVFAPGVLDFTRLLVVVLLVALGAAWIEVMRRQTLHEFPDAQGTAFLADTWERVSGWWEKQRAAARQPPAAAAPPAPAAPPPPATDLASRLTALSELHAKGELTDEEYASAKARVLAGD
jgi:membrane protease YdiL (CAAX protease family)